MMRTSRILMHAIPRRQLLPQAQILRPRQLLFAATPMRVVSARHAGGWFSGLFGGGKQKATQPAPQQQKQQDPAAASTTTTTVLDTTKMAEPPEPPTAHALCSAAFDNDIERCRALLDRGAPMTIAPNAMGLSALHIACLKGHVEVARLLLVDHPRSQAKVVVHTAPLMQQTLQVGPLMALNRASVTPLHVAAVHDQYEIVQMLCARIRELRLPPVPNREDPTQPPSSAVDVRANDERVTPLHLAVKFSKQVGIVEELLATGANPLLFTEEPEPQSPISIACQLGKLDHLKLLFLWAVKLPGVTERDVVELAPPGGSGGSTPLQIACGAGQEHIVRFLIEDCDADPRRYGGSTSSPPRKKQVGQEGDEERPDLCPHPPLYLAAYGGHAGVVRFLLEDVGIKPDEQLVADGASPLHAACNSGDSETVRLLLEHGADRMLKRRSTLIVPLMVACLKGHLNVVKLLLPSSTHLPTLPLTDRHGFTCLHLCLVDGHTAVLEYLLQIGFSAEVPCRADQREVLPLHLAAEAGNAAAVRLLLPFCVKKKEKGASSRDKNLVDARDTLGFTALHAAANSGSVETVQLLVDAGADMGLATRTGETALLLAKTANHKEVVSFLQAHAQLQGNTQQGA